MKLKQSRTEVLHYCQLLRPDGLVVGTSGNISVRDGDLLAITPSGVDYDTLTVADVCVIDMQGNVVEGDRAPTSEVPMHTALYSDPAVRAVVHSHSPYATTLSTVLNELPPIHYMISLLGGPVRVAPFALPGSDELADSVRAGLVDRKAVILQNHGALTTGKDATEAYKNMVNLEWLCTLYYRAQLLSADCRTLTPDEYAAAAEMMTHYGQPPSLEAK